MAAPKNNKPFTSGMRVIWSYLNMMGGSAPVAGKDKRTLNALQMRGEIRMFMLHGALWAEVRDGQAR